MRHRLFAGLVIAVTAFALSIPDAEALGGGRSGGGHRGGSSIGKSHSGSKSYSSSRSYLRGYSRSSSKVGPGTGPKSSSTSVRGHVRKDGSYVPQHRRTNPDKNFNNNWSTKPNSNPYTGKEGSKTEPPPKR